MKESPKNHGAQKKVLRKSLKSKMTEDDCALRTSFIVTPVDFTSDDNGEPIIITMAAMLKRFTKALVGLPLALSIGAAKAVIIDDNGDDHNHSTTTTTTANTNSNLRGIPSYHQFGERERQRQRSHAQKNIKGGSSSSEDHGSDKKVVKQSLAHNMLINQGCPQTSSCGDVCYVLTVEAATDLHSVTTGKRNKPTHHWHDPSSFWRMGVCNAKSQCVSVNPFDKHHNFDDLARILADVEKECDRSMAAANIFLLAKAMEPPDYSCDAAVSYPDALM